MKADTLDLRDIFRKDARYVVPRFQRPYVWKEEEHWQLLWEDLRQVVDELLEHQGGATDRFESAGCEISKCAANSVIVISRGVL